MLLLLSIFHPVWSITLHKGDHWNAIFSGTTTPYTVSLSGKENSSASLTWSLTSNGRTLSQGYQAINLHGQNPISISLPLRAPAVKPGVVLGALLVIDLSSETQSSSISHHEIKLKIYSPELRVENRHFYRNLNIQLYDPSGKSSKALANLGIPHREVSKSQLVNPAEPGLIVLGAEIALGRQRGLMNRLIELASGGLKVLVLHPTSGEILLSELAAITGASPSAMSFADDSIIETFAEEYRWIEDDPMKTHGIELLSYRQATIARVVEGQQNNWDWFYLDFDHSGGRFIVCMLPIIERIDQGPVPPIILNQLIAFASRQQNDL